MNCVLGIDCASGRTGIGVARSGRLLGEMNLDLGRSQAGLLPLSVKSLLSTLAVTLEDLERVAVTSGPGYYTGLRIGVSYACALAEAIGVPLVPLSTLETMAYGQGDPGRILCPVLHARSGHLYAAFFRQEDTGMTTLRAPAALAVSALAGLLDTLDGAVLLGEDAGRYPELTGRPRRPLEGGVRGGAVALMGSDPSRAALPPDRVRINYLRAPDIGPTRPTGS